MKIGIWVLAMGLTFFGCGKQEVQELDNDHVRVTVELGRSEPSPMKSLFGLGRDVELSLFGIPASAAGFTCMAVNIVGEGIPSVDGKDDPSTVLPDLLSGKAFCTYPGILSSALYGAGTQLVALDVPKGKSRVVQVLGVTDSLTCNEITSLGKSASTLQLLATNPDPKIFDLGHVVTDLYTSQTITITNAYDSSTDKSGRTVECGSGGDCYNPVETITNWNGTSPVSTNGTYLAQSFVVTTRMKLASVGLGIPTAGSGMSVQIYSHDSASNVPGSWIVTLNQNYSSTGYVGFGNYGTTWLDPGTYWIRLMDTSNTATWKVSTGDTYSSGVAKTSSNGGSTWSAALSGDFDFNVFRCF